MKIGIVGSGVVGQATGRGFADKGNCVIFHDVITNTIEKLNGRGFQATSDINIAANESDIFFICVPTPDKKRKIDLSYMKSAVKNLAEATVKKKGYFLVVVKSTIIPTTSEKIIIPLFEKYSKKKVGKDFGYCFNPEFLRENHSYEDFVNPDRIVIGEYDKKSGDTLEKLYLPFKAPIIRTNLRTSEIVKYANNCFYATKISFFNEFHMMSEKLGIDSEIIRKVVQLDRFYATHPWEHGHSFGGKCLPKDINAIIAMFNEGHIHNPNLLKAVRKVNEKISKN